MDWDLIKTTFERAKLGLEVRIPQYNYITCKREEWEIVPIRDMIIFEGIFCLYDEEIRNAMDLKIFVHCDDDIRLLRRIKRDVL